MGQSKLRRNREERSELLSLYDESGMSQAALAREFGINYTTFCGWLKRRCKASAEAEVVFQEVEFETSGSEGGWELHYGNDLCLRMGPTPDVEGVARLLKLLRRK